VIRIEEATGEGGVSTVGGILDDVLRTHTDASHEDGGHAGDYCVGLQEFAPVSTGHHGEPSYVLAITYHRWATVVGTPCLEVSRDGEGAARRGCEDGGELASGHAAQERVVHVVVEDVATGASTRYGVVVEHHGFEAELGEECRQPVRATVRTREQ